MISGERHFFLNEETNFLYCVEYIPDISIAKNYAVILCKPIWGERIRTHRIFTNLARLLMNMGFTVITCDYLCDGNSSGETLKLTYPKMVDSVIHVYDYLKKQYQPGRYALIGLRLGANVAASAAGSIQQLKKLILFEPILNPIDDFTRALRANLSNQTVVHKKIIKTREDLIHDIKNGIPVNVDGFLVGKELWESIEAISPFNARSSFMGDALICSLAPPGKAGTNLSQIGNLFVNARTEAIEQEFIWTGWKHYMCAPPVFFNTIRSELQ